MKIKSIIWSFDFIIAFLLAVVLEVYMPNLVSNSLVKEIYNVGISVLSIIFSIYFTALTIIISSGDNEFILFLEEEKTFTALLAILKYTLIVLFLALVYSIGIFAATVSFLDVKWQHQQKEFCVVFAFLFSYSLLATVGSISNSIVYASKRIQFLRLTRK